MKNYDLVRSVEELERLVEKLEADGDVAGFDIETGYHGPPRDGWSLHPDTAFMVGFSFTNSTDWARYVPLGHDLGGNLDPYGVAPLLWRMLKLRIVAHNGKFELRHTARFFMQYLADHPEFGAEVRATNGYWTLYSDSMIEAYLRAELKSFGLKSITQLVFNHTMRELTDLFPDLAKNKQKTLRFNVLELSPEVVNYACEDALWSLAHHLRNYDAVKDMLLYRVEMEVLHEALCDMEDFGVMYDWAYMARGAQEGRVFLDKLNAEIQRDLSEMVGTQVAINLGSPQQIREILYDKLGMRTTRMTRGGKEKKGEAKMSTDAIALVGLAKQYPVVKKITWWKEINKLTGTYLDKYEANYNYAADGRAHPNHMQTAVITGRFAVSDPPYQQTPKKYYYALDSGDEFLFLFRDAIVAPPEHYLLGFDLGQAELRAIAGEANETALLAAFANNEDVHSRTAALMLGIPIDQVTPDLRDIGKTLNFAIAYGMQVGGLAERLAISEEEAQKLFDQYYAAYPALSVWTQRQQAFGRERGYVMSKFGRRLPIWEYQSDKHWIRQKGDRACINYPIQGAATGDYMKIAMVRAVKALKKAGLYDRVHLVMNIHDALEFYVHRSVDPQVVIDVLQPAVVYPVPGWPRMVADWHIGRSWGSKKELGLDENGKIFVKEKGSKPREEPSEPLTGADGEELPELPPVSQEAIQAVVSGGSVPAQGGSVPTLAPDPDRVPAQLSPSESLTPVLPGYEGDGEARTVVVELVDMPDAHSFGRFMDLVASAPGPHGVTLRTPEGELPLTLPQGTGLSPADQPQVSLVLGGARVLWDASDVPAQQIVAGLSL